jgi:transposase
MTEVPMRRPKLEVVDRRQLLLRTVDVEQLVAEDDEVRAIWDLTGRLDLSRFYSAITTQEGEAGRQALDPRLLISLWIYAYKSGVSSAREVSRLCEYHPGFQWLSGMRPVNHHTLSDFRMIHKDALDDLFTQLLGVLSAEGLVTLERVMQDGTKVRAHAGADSFRREERLKEHLRLAREQVAAMGDPRSAVEVAPRLKAARKRAAREKQERLEQALQELGKIRQQPCSKTPPEKMRASMTDPEARVMKHGGGGGYGPSYNVQLSTDAKAGVIVDVAVSQSPVDAQELPGAVDRMEKRLGRKPDQMVADAEYTTNAAVLAMHERKVDFIGSLRPPNASLKGSLARRGIDPAFGPESFLEDPATDSLKCPNGKILSRQRAHVAHFRQEVYYRAQEADCKECRFRMKCTPKYPARVVTRGRLLPIITAFRQRMGTEKAKAIYKQRGGIAEFTNAWLKEKLGLRKFRLRGVAKVTLETMWACLTCNIQLWIRRIWRPAVTIKAT